MIAGLQQRHMVPEILDALPANDSSAIASRRDLIWINAIMLQSRLMAGLMRRHIHTPPKRVLEIGAGDGAFSLTVARRMGSAWKGVDLVMVDQANLLTGTRREDFARLGWRVEPVVSDLFEWLAQSPEDRFDLVFANLVLHHFDSEDLRNLFASMHERANVFVATEPRRNTVALIGASLLRLIGANDVTMHDAAASVRAGFAGKELSSLWPTADSMRFEERRMGLFTHAFAAERI